MSASIDLDVFDVLPGAATATITPLGSSPVTSVVQWEQEEASPASQAVGAGPASALNRRVVVYVRRDHVPTLPVGSLIVGGPAHNQRSWRVVSLGDDPEYHAAVVA